jgi:hypothetical protein
MLNVKDTIIVTFWENWNKDGQVPKFKKKMNILTKIKKKIHRVCLAQGGIAKSWNRITISIN